MLGVPVSGSRTARRRYFSAPTMALRNAAAMRTAWRASSAVHFSPCQLEIPYETPSAAVESAPITAARTAFCSESFFVASIAIPALRRISPATENAPQNAIAWARLSQEYAEVGVHSFRAVATTERIPPCPASNPAQPQTVPATKRTDSISRARFPKRAAANACTPAAPHPAVTAPTPIAAASMATSFQSSLRT